MKKALRNSSFMPGQTVNKSIIEKVSKSTTPIITWPLKKTIITLGISAIKLKGVRYVSILQKTAFLQ